MTAPPEHLLDFDELLAMEEASPVRHENSTRWQAEQWFTRTSSPTSQLPLTEDYAANPVGAQVASSVCERARRRRTGFIPTSSSCVRRLAFIRATRMHSSTRALFEVLSPATAEFDRTGKFDEYALIPELSDYILISSDKIRIEHFHRAGEGEWTRRVYRSVEQELRLESFDISVPLGEIYEDIEIGEQPVLPGMDEDNAAL